MSWSVGTIVVCVDASPGAAPDHPPLVEGWYYAVTATGRNSIGRAWVHVSGQQYQPGHAHFAQRFRLAESGYSEAATVRQLRRA